MPVRVVHRPPGYEAWKDETKFHGPNWRFILIVLGSVFTCGCVSATLTVSFFLSRQTQVARLPTIAVLPSVTPIVTEQRLVVVAAEPLSTATELPPVTETPDLNATLNYLLAQQNELIATTTPQFVLSEPIFCEGAPFEQYAVGSYLKVTFEDIGALRLLDKPRTRDYRPTVLKQLYDGDTVQIMDEPVCGQWDGAPVVYHPVYVERWQKQGWVGFGQRGDVWLEPVT